MFQPGDRVLFTPTEPTLNYAAGIRTVKRMRGAGWVQLECGNVVLLARVDELTKINEQ